MIIIPAIDIKNGRCVRLEQGRMSRETLYSDFPGEVAARWFEQGAERIHVVDLDGAVGGKPVNKNAIGDIARAVPIPIELGGGIRNMDTIEGYLDLGVHQIILGTAAYKAPDFIRRACERFPGRIILGIDARKGHVAVEGWTEETDTTASDMAKRFESVGVAAIIYTDILRDGMRTGPNLEATRTLAEAVRIPVIASGGISGIEDVSEILSLSEYGVTGMIVGKALYEGTLNLSEAVGFLKKAENPN